MDNSIIYRGIRAY